MVISEIVMASTNIDRIYPVFLIGLPFGCLLQLCIERIILIIETKT